MVRINLVDVSKLSDQHLVAEYDEILMLVSYIKRYSKFDGTELKQYCLGKGHMKFFKDKVLYLKKRHELLKIEMRKRGFVTRKNIVLSTFSKKNINDWKPTSLDVSIVTKRILSRIKAKFGYYRYYGTVRSYEFFRRMLA
ncbi:MAG: pyrimidine dimer DNA glycosylase/endonuclease V [Candidatus Woesearchaeota archaeon]